jgi:hypothetical protein
MTEEFVVFTNTPAKNSTTTHLFIAFVWANQRHNHTVSTADNTKKKEKND